MSDTDTLAAIRVRRSQFDSVWWCFNRWRTPVEDAGRDIDALLSAVEALRCEHLLRDDLKPTVH